MHPLCCDSRILHFWGIETSNASSFLARHDDNMKHSKVEGCWSPFWQAELHPGSRAILPIGQALHALKFELDSACSELYFVNCYHHALCPFSCAATFPCIGAGFPYQESIHACTAYQSSPTKYRKKLFTQHCN